MRRGTTAWLRAEAVAVLIAAVTVHFLLGYGWLPFLFLLLVPDLSMLGYLAGPRLGAAAYNAAHAYIAPAVILGFAALDLASGSPGALPGPGAPGGAGSGAAAAWTAPVGLIWLAHIAMDRALGYGLKEATGFGDTHLGPLGR